MAKYRKRRQPRRAPLPSPTYERPPITPEEFREWEEAHPKPWSDVPERFRSSYRDAGIPMVADIWKRRTGKAMGAAEGPGGAMAPELRRYATGRATPEDRQMVKDLYAAPRRVMPKWQRALQTYLPETGVATAASPLTDLLASFAPGGARVSRRRGRGRDLGAELSAGLKGVPTEKLEEAFGKIDPASPEGKLLTENLPAYRQYRLRMALGIRPQTAEEAAEQKLNLGLKADTAKREFDIETKGMEVTAKRKVARGKIGKVTRDVLIEEWGITDQEDQDDILNLRKQGLKPGASSAQIFDQMWDMMSDRSNADVIRKRQKEEAAVAKAEKEEELARQVETHKRKGELFKTQLAQVDWEIKQAEAEGTLAAKGEKTVAAKLIPKLQKSLGELRDKRRGLYNEYITHLKADPSFPTPTPETEPVPGATAETTVAQPAMAEGGTKKLTLEITKKYLKQANGDKEKAKQLAAADGYEINA